MRALQESGCSKELEQWFFKVTQYAEELLSRLDTLDWPEPIKLAQKNWIGRSKERSLNLNYKLQATSYKLLLLGRIRFWGDVYGACAGARTRGTTKEQIKKLERSRRVSGICAQKTELERAHLEKEKSGVPLEGVTAINPANNQEIPVWIADYVLASYGTGAIMAVPAHDERDFAFAKNSVCRFAWSCVRTLRRPARA